MEKTITIFLVLFLAISIDSNSQQFMVLHTPEDIKKPASGSNRAPVYEFKSSQIDKQLAEISEDQLPAHLFGESITRKFYLFESIYTYEVPTVPGNPQVKTMVRKPVIYDAVQKVDKHLRKEVKKGEKTVEEATVAMNKVLDTAISILTADTKDFEKAISKTSDVESLTNLFLFQVKLVM